MDFFTQQVSQECGIACAPLSPQNYAVNTNTNINAWTSAPLDMLMYKRAFGLLNVGVIVGAGAANTVNAAFLAGNTSNTLQAVTGAAWNWATISGGPTLSFSGNINFGTLEMRSDQLPSGQRYLAMIVSNIQAAFFDAWLLGFASEYKPGGKGSIANVLNSGVGQLNTVQGLTQSVM